MKNISNIIASKTGNDDLLERLQQLPGTELNSILLELFRKRAADVTPAVLLQQFESNRFAAPSTLDVVAFKELETSWLKLAEKNGFQSIILSPLTPLGTCAAFKTIDQNNVVSALRGTEVVSDATNVFALLVAQQYKKTKSRNPIKYVTTDRLVRAQGLANPGHTPHFGIYCMATGGFNNGGLVFEMEQLLQHLTIHLSLLSSVFAKKDLSIKILLKENNAQLHAALQAMLEEIGKEYSVDIIQQEEPNAYYGIVQFKTFLQYNGNEINMSDGGFVNWTQQLLSNKKHRFLISGIGIELVYKLMKGMI
jgi:hypothetical protein